MITLHVDSCNTRSQHVLKQNRRRTPRRSPFSIPHKVQSHLEGSVEGTTEVWGSAISRGVPSDNEVNNLLHLSALSWTAWRGLLLHPFRERAREDRATFDAISMGRRDRGLYSVTPGTRHFGRALWLARVQRSASLSSVRTSAFEPSSHALGSQQHLTTKFINFCGGLGVLQEFVNSVLLSRYTRMVTIGTFLQWDDRITL